VHLQRKSVAPGTVVEYAEFGDPNGVPAVFFHGFIGSVHQASKADAAAKTAGLRIIAPHRPGVGGSTAITAQAITGAVQPTIQLLQLLGITRCSSIGVSGGAPYALALAAVEPQLVKNIVLASPLGPLVSHQIRRDMKTVLRLLLAMGLFGQAGRAGMQNILRLKQKKFTRDLPVAVLEFVQQVSPADSWRFADNIDGALDMFVADHQIALQHRSSTAQLSLELARYWKWGFDLTEVPPVPCSIWHGQDDTLVPLASAQYLANKMPHAVLKTVTGGHFAMLGQLDDMCRFAAAA
jgi:pimeloyl-ACP methyl ester carboxylesterase